MSDLLFKLRIELGTYGGLVDPVLAITAWEGKSDFRDTHTRIDVQAALVSTVDGKRRTSIIFKRGDTWCGIPAHQSIDGDAAKECVLSLLSMKPGDTDEDYFESYTAEQLAFATRYGDDLSCEAMARYGEQ